MNNLIKIANFLESIQMYKTSDMFIRVAQFQPVKPANFGKQDTILTDRENPISIWADPDYNAALKANIGSGVFSVEPNILKTLDGVPARFKNLDLDDVMSQINNIIPAFDPLAHGSFDNYRRFILPSILEDPEKREFLEDAEQLMKVFRAYLASKIMPKFSDPKDNEDFKKGIEKILFYQESSSPLSVAFEVLGEGQAGETPASGSSRPRGSAPSRTAPGTGSGLRSPGVTSPFGNRDNPNNPGTTQFHSGVDMPANVGTPVKAALKGEVTFAGTQRDYGKIIKIQHTGGLESRYAHLDKISVNQGDNVTSGQVIGASGDSGNATGPHLHFEMRSNGTPINPSGYMGIVL